MKNTIILGKTNIDIDENFSIGTPSQNPSPLTEVQIYWENCSAWVSTFSKEMGGNSGGQAKIKESTELASYTTNSFCKESLREEKLFKYVRMASPWAVESIPGPKIERNIIFSEKYICCVNFNWILGHPTAYKKLPTPPTSF